MKVRYFAWVRERIGRSDEQIEPPAEVQTIADLIDWLAARGPEYAAAFADTGVVRAAIDFTHVDHDASVRKAGEVAFFPPVTGG
ncbi:MAG: molybdopterin converting factor subunit 1 [Alphaproteobacteria bacterium]